MNSSYVTPNGYSSIYNAFKFKDATSLQGLPIQGKYNSYDGSGFVYEMRGKLNYIQGNLSLLREMNWIDRQTRVIFVEFSAYNPNINMLMVTTLMFEHLSSGSILSSARFDTLNLFGEIRDGIFSFKIFSEIIFMLLIVFFTIEQILEITKMGPKKYIEDFWFLIEWSIILTAFVSCFMFVLRYTEAQNVLDFFKKTGGYGYIKFQKVNGYNQTLTFSLGFCSWLGTLKCLKMLRFNQNISILGVTLKRCFEELMSFSVAFFIIWIAFVQLMYLMFVKDIEGYSSLIKSMETAFEVMLGKANIGEYIQSNAFFGPIIFSGYNIAILFFALNIFISIIIESFENVRTQAKENPQMFGFFDHILKKIKRFFRQKTKNCDLPSHEKYKDHLGVFSTRLDSLIDYIIQVKFNS